MRFFRTTVTTSLAIGTYLKNKFTSTNQSFKKFSTSLHFRSTKNFKGHFGTKCFAESDAFNANLQKKEIHLKNISHHYCADDIHLDDLEDLCDDIGFTDKDVWEENKGRRFLWNGNWCPEKNPGNGTKLVILVSASHIDSTTNLLSPLGEIQNDCFVKRLQGILQSHDPAEFFCSSHYIPQMEAHFRNIFTKYNLSAYVKVLNAIDENNPGIYDPINQGDIFENINEVDNSNLETTFKGMFNSSSGNNNVVGVFLTHPNIIRYMLMKTLQFPLNAWKRFQVSPGSITIVQVMNDRKVFVNQIGSHFFHRDINNKFMANKDPRVYED